MISLDDVWLFCTCDKCAADEWTYVRVQQYMHASALCEMFDHYIMHGLFLAINSAQPRAPAGAVREEGSCSYLISIDLIVNTFRSLQSLHFIVTDQ